MNPLLLDALKCQNSGRKPVWFMRQAGRYMPEYRRFREKHLFLEMCHNPELAAEITQLPLKAFGMDAAILFSDILMIVEAMDLGLRFDDGIGPIIERPLTSAADVDRLPREGVVEKLRFVGTSIRHLVPQLKVPLIGFCGAPFTVASYMIEGKSSKDLKKTKQWMLRNPESFHKLLDHIASCTIEYLRMQIEAGVHAIQIFDSWAHVLAISQFREFSLEYMRKVMAGIAHYKIPFILFCKGSSFFAGEIAKISPSAISLDWSADLADIRRSIPSSIALQGNLDPDFLYAPHASLKKEVQRLLKSMQHDQGYVFNLGHGIAPDVSPEAVKLIVETVKNG